MYVLLVVSLAIFGYGFWRRIRIWRRGRRPRQIETAAAEGQPPAGIAGDILAAAGRVLREVVAQQRIARVPAAWLSHVAIFYGFIVLFIGTVLVAIEHYGIAHFFFGDFYRITSFLLDLFGLVFIAGLVLAIARRAGLTRVRPSSKPVDAAILWLLLLIAVTGFVIEGLRIAAQQPEFERVSFVGWWLALIWSAAGLSAEAAAMWHFGTWWLHMLLVFGFIAVIPYTKLLHVLVAPANIALTAVGHSGRLEPVSLSEVEETGRFGVETIADFERPRLLSFDACTHCRRCESACPAHATSKPLSPMRVVHDLAASGEREGSLHGDVITAETLWACTTCGACVHQCPVLINQLGAIIDLRRHLVGEGQVLGSSQAALRSIAAHGNPWGLPRAERAAWAEGLAVPTIEENPQPEILLWVGCAGSYDRRNQQVSRALVQIFTAAGVNFAILGCNESCTGDPARRIGDEFTFMEATQQNVETLNKVAPPRIVTACAHCFNTLGNEYPDFGGSYEVVHHTQFLRELAEAGRLPMDAGDSESITFHDPCYLSRHNGAADAPRAVFAKLGGNESLREPQQHGAEGFCCGAGGGRMWMEEDIDKRVNFARWDQLKATGAKTVAVGCPYCMTMMDDAAKNDEAAGIAVRDIAELVAERLNGANT